MGWSATGARLESGVSHLGQNLMGVVPADDTRFACRPLEAIDLLAAFGPSLGLETNGAVEIGRLAPHPPARPRHRLRLSPQLRRRLPLSRHPAEHRLREPDAA
jgi:hypothetical protein